MNFLILSVTAGEGHNSTAKAIKSRLEAAGEGAVILDTLDYVSPELARIVSDGYLLVTEKARQAYKLGYNLAEKRKQGEHKMTELLGYAMSDDLAAYIKAEGFDVIVFTHPFAGAILGAMKKHGIIDLPTVGILTDFTFHPYWEDCTANDFVVTPDKLLTLQGLKKGFRAEQILPFGIPINPKFSSRVSKAEARRKLGLDAECTTFLIMGGSMGYGNIAENVKKIDAMDVGREFQLVCVCGNNAEMKSEVEAVAAESRRRILVTGFIDYVSLVMDASDCIITKPGGLTTSESLAKGLPMIIVNPIPGQEERNAEFLTNCGCAMMASKSCPIDECIYQLLTSGARLEAMGRCIGEIGKADSAKVLAEFLVDLAHTPRVSEFV